jgi:hypothetical protein
MCYTCIYCFDIQEDWWVTCERWLCVRLLYVQTSLLVQHTSSSTVCSDTAKWLLVRWVHKQMSAEEKVSWMGLILTHMEHYSKKCLNGGVNGILGCIGNLPHIKNTTGAVSLECIALPIHYSAQTFTWWLHVFVPQMNCFERKCFWHDEVKAKVCLWVQVQSPDYFHVKIEQDMKMCLLPPSSGLPDDGGSNHLWNIGQFIPDYMVQHPRRQSSSNAPP